MDDCKNMTEKVTTIDDRALEICMILSGCFSITQGIEIGQQLLATSCKFCQFCSYLFAGYRESNREPMKAMELENVETSATCSTIQLYESINITKKVFVNLKNCNSLGFVDRSPYS